MLWKYFNRSTPKTETEAVSASEPMTNNLPMAFLQSLIPLNNLSSSDLQQLSTPLRSYAAGETLFKRGEASERISYLYKGKVFLESEPGTGYYLEPGHYKACYPLATKGIHAVNAIAQTPVQLIDISLSDLGLCSRTLDDPQSISASIASSTFQHALGNCFLRAFQAGSLLVPSLPDVAMRLRTALQKQTSIADAVKIINIDPAIASKLIQVANSPAYCRGSLIGNSHDAVNLLGFKTTQNLVTSISLHQLFKSHNPQLNSKIQQIWKQSIQVASLSHTLARLTNKINADEALLAGLTHNIGALPIITLAGSLQNTNYSEEELDQTIDNLQGLLGSFILQKWHFPSNLQPVPQQTDNWYYDDHQALQLSDIVILAKYHNRLGTSQAAQLPPLNTLPAFQKLGNNALTPEMSLKALQDAKQQITETLSFFRT